jgi:hypothetical protein
MITRQQIENTKNITQLKNVLKNELKAGVSGMKSAQFKEAKKKALKAWDRANEEEIKEEEKEEQEEQKEEQKEQSLPRVRSPMEEPPEEAKIQEDPVAAQIEGVYGGAELDKKLKEIQKGLNKKTLEDGSWLTNMTSMLGAPELKAYEMALKGAGIAMSKEDKAKLGQLIRGEYKGSTADAIKIIGNAAIDPEGWGVMTKSAAEKRGKKVVNDFKDILKKENPYTERQVAEMGTRLNIEQKKLQEKKDIERAKRKARYQGKEYTGAEYEEDPDWERSLDIPRLSQYGGQDRRGFWEKMGKLFKDAGVGLAETVVDPLGLIEIVKGETKKTPLLIELENELKKKDPAAFRRYERDMNKHITALSKTKTGKGNKVLEGHKPIQNQMRDILKATLEENSKMPEDKRYLSVEDVDELEGYLYELETEPDNITYSELDKINKMTRKITHGKLPEKLQDKLNILDKEQQGVLSKKSAGDTDLSLTKESEVRDEISEERKKEQQEAIKERRIDIENENRKVIETRADLISTGYVDTDNKNRPELRPRIVWGNTDAQLMPTPEEDENDDEIVEHMMMWPQLSTQDNSRDNILFRRQNKIEKKRYQKTFAVPKDNGSRKVVKINNDQKMGYMVNYCDYESIPEAFIRFSSKKLIPVYAPKSEQQPLHIKPEECQGPFLNPRPAQDFTINQKRTEEVIVNRFPERILQGYPAHRVLANRGRRIFKKRMNRFKKNRRRY